MKENWETANLPLKDQDDHLLRVLEKVKSGYDKVGGRRGLTEADIDVLKKVFCDVSNAKPLLEAVLSSRCP